MSRPVPEPIEAARRAGFYPLVLLLDRLAGGGGDEAIRFRHDPALAFSAADVVRVTPREGAEGDPTGWTVVTTFLGLTGGVTPLPHYLAEEVAQEDPEAGRLRDFLDLFHHRLLALFFRARLQYDPVHAHRSDHADAWTARLLALAGIDQAAGEGSAVLPPHRLLRLLPLLVEPGPTAHGLAAALADLLEEELGEDGGEVRVAVEPFAGAWARLADDEVTRLGRHRSRLGQDALLGQRVWDAAGRFLVRIGPLEATQYQRFVHGGLTGRVEQLVDALVTEPLEREIQLLLAENAAPALALGRARLGRDAWLGGQRRASAVSTGRAT